MTDNNVTERLKEIRERYKAGKLIPYHPDDREFISQVVNDISFLIAVLDAEDFEFWCNNCRRPFKSVDALTSHTTCGVFQMKELPPEKSDK